MRQPKETATPSSSREIDDAKQKQQTASASLKRLVTVQGFHDCCISYAPFTIRKKIREGVIPAHPDGKRYLIDPEEAIEALKKHKS